MCACACAGCVPLRPRGRAAAAHQSGNQVRGRQRKLCVVVFWRTDGGTNQLKGRIQNQGSACTVWHLCTHESHAPRRHQTGCCALLLLCVAQCAQRLPEPTLEDGWPRISRSLYLPMQSPALLPTSRAGGAGQRVGVAACRGCYVLPGSTSGSGTAHSSYPTNSSKLPCRQHMMAWGKAKIFRHGGQKGGAARPERHMHGGQ